MHSKHSLLVSEELESLNYSHSCQTLDAHYHDTYSVGFILKGACHFETNNQSYIAARNDIVVMNPQQVHTGGSKIEQLDFVMYYPSFGLMKKLGFDKQTFPHFTHPLVRGVDVATIRDAIEADESLHSPMQNSAC